MKLFFLPVDIRHTLCPCGFFILERCKLTLLEPHPRFGDAPLKFQVVCPQNGTAVLKGLIGHKTTTPVAPINITGDHS